MPPSNIDRGDEKGVNHGEVELQNLLPSKGEGELHPLISTPPPPEAREETEIKIVAQDIGRIQLRAMMKRQVLLKVRRPADTARSAYHRNIDFGTGGKSDTTPQLELNSPPLRGRRVVFE